MSWRQFERLIQVESFFAATKQEGIKKILRTALKHSAKRQSAQRQFA
jgi:hypothetical protein